MFMVTWVGRGGEEAKEMKAISRRADTLVKRT